MRSELWQRMANVSSYPPGDSCSRFGSLWVLPFQPSIKSATTRFFGVLWRRKPFWNSLRDETHPRKGKLVGLPFEKPLGGRKGRIDPNVGATARAEC